MNQPGTLAAAHDARNERLARILRTGRAAAGQFPVAVLVLVLGFLVLYPIGAVVLNSLLTGGADEAVGFSAWQEAFHEPGLVRSITNTFKVQLVTQGISLPVAILIAWILARTDVPFGRTIEFGFWIMFFLPALGVTTGWLLFFDAHFGLANRWLTGLGIVESAPFDMFSYWGIVFAHLTTYAVSVKVMLLTPAFRNLDGAIEEASRICGASPLGTLFRVVVPIMTPAIFVVFLMSLIRGLEAFEIELFLGMPFDFMVYSTEIYRLVANAPPDYAKASVLATSILVTMLPLIILQRWAATRRSYAVVSGRSTANVTPLGRWRWPLFLLLACLVCFMSLLPLTLLITGSFMTLFGFFDVPNLWTADHWRTALDDSTFAQGFRNMLVLGVGTALIAVVVYSLVAYCAVRLKSLWQAPLDILSWLPLAIPGIILGFGYLFMLLQVPVFRAVYGTIFALILVSFLASMTLGVQVLKVHMLQIGEEIEEAGRVVGGSWLRTFLSIITPLTAPALAVVGVLIFASTIRQIGSIILLSTGETRVLALLQLEFLGDGRLGPAAVIGTVIVLISLLAAVLIRIVSVRFGIRAGPG